MIRLFIIAVLNHLPVFLKLFISKEAEMYYYLLVILNSYRVNEKLMQNELRETVQQLVIKFH